MTMKSGEYLSPEKGMIEVGETDTSSPTTGSVPTWVQDEIKATWNAARSANGQLEAFRIIERMVDRLGYGRMTDNPSLAQNVTCDLRGVYKRLARRLCAFPRKVHALVRYFYFDFSP